MNPPCTILNNRIFPLVRALVARKLSKEGLPQSRIASNLHISQAMVSKYLSQQLPMEPFEEEEYLASEIADKIRTGTSEAALTGLVCQWCFQFKEKGQLCPYHPVTNCSVCMTLRSREAVGDRYTVLENIEKAVEKLGNVDMQSITPQVRCNIAVALLDAENIMDVAAIPGRLVPIGTGVRALAPPEFGASRHLASLLLGTMTGKNGIRAVMNITFNNRIKMAIKKIGLPMSTLDRTCFSDLETFLDSREWKDEVAIVDPGDFGIEPCTYLFGKNVHQVVEKALNILSFIR